MKRLYLVHKHEDWTANGEKCMFHMHYDRHHFVVRNRLIAYLLSLIRIFDFVNVRLTMFISCCVCACACFFALLSFDLLLLIRKKWLYAPMLKCLRFLGFNFKHRLTLSFWLRPIYHTGGRARWVCHWIAFTMTECCIHYNIYNVCVCDCVFR